MGSHSAEVRPKGSDMSEAKYLLRKALEMAGLPIELDKLIGVQRFTFEYPDGVDGTVEIAGLIMGCEAHYLVPSEKQGLRLKLFVSVPSSRFHFSHKRIEWIVFLGSRENVVLVLEEDLSQHGTLRLV